MRMGVIEELEVTATRLPRLDPFGSAFSSFELGPTPSFPFPDFRSLIPPLPRLDLGLLTAEQREILAEMDIESRFAEAEGAELALTSPEAAAGVAAGEPPLIVPSDLDPFPLPLPREVIFMAGPLNPISELPADITPAEAAILAEMQAAEVFFPPTGVPTPEAIAEGAPVFATEIARLPAEEPVVIRPTEPAVIFAGTPLEEPIEVVIRPTTEADPFFFRRSRRSTGTGVHQEVTVWD